uniref:hypothetical protein n=1 Tax=Sphingomonas bacterium TaxID=1895847 RepID=UPI00341D44F1
MALAITTSASAETLNNGTVIALTQAGLGDEAIIAKIKTSSASYDLSTDQIIALKKQGVSGPVIAAMLSASNPTAGTTAFSMDAADPAVPHPPGVYLLVDGPTPSMKRIDATVSNQAKTGGILGYALTSGIASMSIKAAIPGESARTNTISAQPVFYFFFDESNPDSARQAVTWSSGSNASVTSPNEFTLVKLDQKKGRREARVGSMNIGGAKTGVMDKDQIPFDYDMVRPGVFKATPRMALKPGEYGFMYAITGGGGGGFAGGAMTARIFDFSVR